MVSADLQQDCHFVDLNLNPVFFIYLPILTSCPWGNWAVSSFTPLQRENMGLLCIIKRREAEKLQRKRAVSDNLSSTITVVSGLLTCSKIKLSWNLAMITAMCLSTVVKLDLNMQAANARGSYFKEHQKGQTGINVFKNFWECKSYKPKIILTFRCREQNWWNSHG